MSTKPAENQDSDDSHCKNAQEYAKRQVVEAAGKIVTSEELAEKYKCTQEYMQNTLRNLAKEGEIKQVGRSRYAAFSGDVVEEKGEEEGNSGGSIPSVDGGALSRDTDTPATSPVDEDTEGVECPEEGCDFEGYTPEQLRGHANSKTNHDWGEVKENIDTEEFGNTESEGDSMVSERELELQRESYSDDQEEDSGNDQAEVVVDEQDGEIVEEVTETTEKGIPLAVSSTTLIVAVAVGIAALWLFTQYNLKGTQDQQEEQEQDAGVAAARQVKRGLI